MDEDGLGSWVMRALAFFLWSLVIGLALWASTALFCWSLGIGPWSLERVEKEKDVNVFTLKQIGKILQE